MSEFAHYGMGRLEALDPRDELYRMSALAFAEVPLPSYRYWISCPPINQGGTSACVGAAWRAFLECSPVMVRPGIGPSWQEIYRRAQEIDEFVGAEPAMQGSSVRAGAKVLHAEGYLTEYVWARTIEEVRRFVLTQGPVVFGSLWHRSMMRPDAQGRLTVSGAVEGGHAYLVRGYSRDKQMFRIQNSWGTWGQNGAAWIHEADLERLLLQGGECCSAREPARS